MTDGKRAEPEITGIGQSHHDPAYRLVREAEALTITGLGRTAFRDKVRSGEIVPPLKLTNHAVAWRLSDLMAWIDSRPRADRRAA